MENALIRIAIHLNIFGILSESERPLSASEIAEMTRVDVVLLERVLRGLAAMEAVAQVNIDSYAATKISKAFTTPKGVSETCFL